MEKLRRSILAKGLAILLIWISLVGICFGSLSIFVRGEVLEDNAYELKQSMMVNMEKKYGSMLLLSSWATPDQRERQTVWKGLEGGSLEYAVEERVTKLVSGELVTTSKVIYGDETLIKEKDYDTQVGAFYLDNIENIEYSEEEILLFDAFNDSPYPTTLHCHFVLKDEVIENNMQYVSADNKNGLITLNNIIGNNESENANSEIETVGQLVYYNIYLRHSNPSGYPTSVFSNGYRDNMHGVAQLANFLFYIRKIKTPILGLSIVVMLLGISFLAFAAGWKKQNEKPSLSKMDTIFYEVFFAIYVLVIGLIIAACGGVIYGLELGIFEIEETLIVCLLATFVATIVSCLAIMSIAVRIKTKNFFRYTICYHLVRPIRKVGQMLLELWNTKEIKKWNVVALFLWGGVSVIQLILLSAISGGELLVLFFLYKLLELALIVWLLWQIQKLYMQGQQLVLGCYDSELDTTGMLPIFKRHGNHLNSMAHGIAVAVEEQTKSERMKTELITNVSHDIKTPLTSIINYVDLIKKENPEDEKIQEYLQVLDRQSIRLKKLIDDLMEASKASSGAIEIKLEPCDVVVMLHQMQGEYLDKLQEKGLELIFHTKEETHMILADGRHLSRVLDNLMSNIYKYGLENTRVYVDVDSNEQYTTITMKNISKNSLNISSEELMERFVRGDASRNTEGNGLGLSIAKSLTERMNGTMRIDVDGDLFKVVISLKGIS